VEVVDGYSECKEFLNLEERSPEIVNASYIVGWYENDPDIYVGWMPPSAGKLVTTTVKEVGLIDSYKEVTPTLVSPGTGNVLTYYLHIVNSSALPLAGVTAWSSAAGNRLP
jgi:hypothetical protein